MKLTFRGNSYEVPDPIKLDSDRTDRPQIKLIYRGNTYYYTPVPEKVVEEADTDEPTVTLIYRGNTYKRKIPTLQPARSPLAINWRLQLE